MPDARMAGGQIAVEALAAANGLAADAAPPPLPCANCGMVLSGPYCSQCGQHVADFHRSVWRFVTDFFDNVLGWDNKLFRTLGPLFRQPGFLTREFMAGRRVRYVHPLRLFLFTSAVCLTLLQFGHDHFNRSKTRRKHTAEKTSDFQWIVSDKSPQVVAPSPPAAASARPADVGDRISKTVEDRVARNGGQERSNQMISEGVQRRLSWVALALLPVFALLLRAMYWRRDAFYFAHLVFSLHYHTFLLLFWTAYTAAGIVAAYLPWSSLLDLVLRLGLLLPLVYLFAALRRMYGEGPRRTFAKVLVLGCIHLLMIFVCLAMVGAAAFFTTTPR
jgi:hypothetical protein